MIPLNHESLLEYYSQTFCFHYDDRTEGKYIYKAIVSSLRKWKPSLVLDPNILPLIGSRLLRLVEDSGVIPFSDFKG